MTPHDFEQKWLTPGRLAGANADELLEMIFDCKEAAHHADDAERLAYSQLRRGALAIMIRLNRAKLLQGVEQIVSGEEAHNGNQGTR